MQSGRKARTYFRAYHAITRQLLNEMRTRREVDPDDGSIGAHLLRIRDARGQLLSDEVILPHIGMLFFAGFDTTGHTMAWTLCAPTCLTEPSVRMISLAVG